MRLGFRHLVATTTGMTFVLILLGVYTGAIGAGLSCGARWPLCNGAVFGLFPADWPSFVEWFHRFVAMVTGFMILGTTYAAWKRQPRTDIRWASTVALAVLPVQVLLGANTIWFYGPVAQVLHHTAALTIFAALTAATAWAFQGTTSTADTATDADADTSAEGSSDPVRL
ncbi:cytochrome AA3 biosynthesis protein [Halorientalis sp. IM1011]|uniref:COX15/CtaA family protein n=1 Tax=Halorientalis sp. IM1011 TaxID=1932360 RepID=UPI00097CD214|nr:COX15/CtaA family protein [Halorientalis sp. IM1011]AQL43738.1 cytochrome AA3 biosynthesis protein [Halorientalis sp. IM1011]